VRFPVPTGEKPTTPALAILQGPPPSTAGVDLSPSTDDRPFFFFDRSIFDTRPAGATLSNLRNAVLVTASLTLLLFLLPLTRWRPPVQHELLRGTGYFFAIGVAFMLVEATLIQRFVLYLGHPSYATTVVLACILLGAGAGSFLSARAAWVRRGLIATLIAMPMVTLALPTLFRATLAQPLGLRVTLACVVLVTLGLMLGQWLPAGMQRFDDRNRPWFWAVNGIASVLAMTVSVALSIELGFALVSALGCCFYVAALGLLRPGSGAASAAAAGSATSTAAAAAASAAAAAGASRTATT
jgi:hypothetical protein